MAKKKAEGELTQQQMVAMVLLKEPDLTGQDLADKVKAEFNKEISKATAGVLRSKARKGEKSTTVKKPKAAPSATATNGTEAGLEDFQAICALVGRLGLGIVKHNLAMIEMAMGSTNHG